MAKYRNCKYKIGYLCRGSNIYLDILTCKDKVVIMLIL